MTYTVSNKNNKWKKDNTGHYIEFAQNTQLIEVSLNFDNLLGTSEVVDNITADTTLTVNTTFPFFLGDNVGNYELAVIQFTNLDTVGLFPVSVTVITNQNRTYKPAKLKNEKRKNRKLKTKTLKNLN